MGGRFVAWPWLAVVFLAVLFGQVATLAATEGDPEPEESSAGERSRPDLWPASREVEGMISLAYDYASDSAGPNTSGVRAGFGYFGRPANDYPWGEFWAAYRKNGDFNITAAGLSVTHASLTSRRLGLGTLVDLGLSRRRSGDRTVFAGMVGVGAEGVLRISRCWDAILAVEAVYRTTGDFEMHARGGIRFHHGWLPAPANGP